MRWGFTMALLIFESIFELSSINLSQLLNYHQSNMAIFTRSKKVLRYFSEACNPARHNAVAGYSGNRVRQGNLFSLARLPRLTSICQRKSIKVLPQFCHDSQQDKTFEMIRFLNIYVCD